MIDQQVPFEVRNISTTVRESFIHHIYVTEMNDFLERHFDALSIIRSAEEEDEIHLYITSFGGYTDLADMYACAISESKAKIVTHGIGTVASAAAMLFLLGDERIPEPGTLFMLHNVQISMDGDSANLSKRMAVYDRHHREKYYPLYSEILTEEELGELFERSGEVYLTTSEMIERLGKVEPSPRRVGDAGREDEGIFRAADLVIMPYPKEDIEEASNFTDGTEFTVRLNEGYEKTFRLSSICPEDFDEYNMQELYEIGSAFDLLACQLGHTREDHIETIIDTILGRFPGGDE